MIDSITKTGISETTYLIHDPDGTPLVLATHGGVDTVYTTDQLGSPVALINTANTVSATYSYDPYGTYTTTGSTGTAAGINPYRYAAGVYDRTTGWQKYGQRFQDPTGTFTAPDTISRLADPTNGNAYAYAADDPTNNTDPTGPCSGDVACAGEAIAGALGVATGAELVETSAAAFAVGVIPAGILLLGLGFIAGGVGTYLLVDAYIGFTS